MKYVITISKNNEHFFSTAGNSILTLRQLMVVYGELKTRFPASEGWVFQIRKWETIGTEVKI